MAGPVAALNWAELVVAGLVILGTGYGAFRATLNSINSGYIHRYIIEPRMKAKAAHEQVDDVAEQLNKLDCKVEDVADNQELQTDAVLALGEAMNNGVDFDVDEFRQRASDRKVDRFLDNDD